MTTKDKAVIVIAYRTIKEVRNTLVEEIAAGGRVPTGPDILSEVLKLIEDNFSRWINKGSGVLDTVIASLEETMETRT